jgi:biotin transport system substrate-specific component
MGPLRKMVAQESLMTATSIAQLQARATGTSKALQAVLGGILIALSAQIAIPLPFTPVPIALANSVCIMLGIVLGPRVGAAAVFFYLLQAACGLPVLAGGKAGLLALASPTGGYLVGYVLGAATAGLVSQRLGFSRGRILLAAAIGHLPVYACGVAVLAQFVGWSHVLVAGVLPFLPGCALKTVALASLLPRSWLRAPN